jgi:Rrf2 family protein
MNKEFLTLFDRGFMVRIDKKLEHALIVLNHLGKLKENKLFTAKELSSIYNIAFDSASRVMQRMASEDFLISVQGPIGGYKLSENIYDKTLLDLLNALTKKNIEIARCISGNCEKKELCNIIDPVESLNEKLTVFYNSIKLSELLYSKV